MINAIPELKKSHATLLIRLGLAAAGGAAGCGAPVTTSMRTLTPAKNIAIRSIFLISLSVGLRIADTKNMKVSITVTKISLSQNDSLAENFGEEFVLPLAISKDNHTS
jgi:hypothetical protein